MDVDAMSFLRSVGRARKFLDAERGHGFEKCPALELHNVFRFYIKAKPDHTRP